MNEYEKLKKLIHWLISQGIVTNQEDLSYKLGYNPSAVSQIVNGKKPLSRKFAQKICSLSEKINQDYLFKEEEMIIESFKNASSHTEKELLLLEIIHQKDNIIAKLNQEIGSLAFQIANTQNTPS